MNISNNKNTIIISLNNTESQIEIIKRQISNNDNEISNLNYISQNPNGDFNETELNSIKFEIKNLTDQVTQWKYRISELKYERIEIKCKLATLDIANKIFYFNELISEKKNELADKDSKLIQQKAQLVHLENSYESLKWIRDNEKIDVEAQLNECEASILQQKNEIISAENEIQKISLFIKNHDFKTNALEGQIFNLEENARLKKRLFECKSSLQAAGQESDAKGVEENLKLEMKEILKAKVHSRSSLCLQLQFNDRKAYLGGLDFLIEQGKGVDEKKYQEVKATVQLLEKQIESELRKTLFQKELKEAQSTLEDLKPLIGCNDLEDVREAVNKEVIKITNLTKEIEQITLESIAVIKTFNEKEAAKLSENMNAIKLLESSMTVAAMNMIVEELQKWLSENVLEGASGGNIKESIISAAALQIAKAKLENRNAKSIEPSEKEELAQKVKKTIIESCEKFCMMQIIEHVLSLNPLMAGAYALGIVGQHYTLGDGELTSLGEKLTKFGISTSIKTAGTLLFGTAIVGSISSGLFISAGTYLAYLAIYQCFTGHDTGAAKVTNNLSDAGIEMMADALLNQALQGIVI